MLYVLVHIISAPGRRLKGKLSRSQLRKLMVIYISYTLYYIGNIHNFYYIHNWKLKLMSISRPIAPLVFIWAWHINIFHFKSVKKSIDQTGMYIFRQRMIKTPLMANWGNFTDHPSLISGNGSCTTRNVYRSCVAEWEWQYYF